MASLESRVGYAVEEGHPHIPLLRPFDSAQGERNATPRNLARQRKKGGRVRMASE